MCMCVCVCVCVCVCMCVCVGSNVSLCGNNYLLMVSLLIFAFVCNI